MEAALVTEEAERAQQAEQQERERQDDQRRFQGDLARSAAAMRRAEEERQDQERLRQGAPGERKSETKAHVPSGRGRLLEF